MSFEYVEVLKKSESSPFVWTWYPHVWRNCMRFLKKKIRNYPFWFPLILGENSVRGFSDFSRSTRWWDDPSWRVYVDESKKLSQYVPSFWADVCVYTAVKTWDEYLLIPSTWTPKLNRFDMFSKCVLLFLSEESLIYFNWAIRLIQ